MPLGANSTRIAPIYGNKMRLCIHYCIHDDAQRDLRITMWISNEHVSYQVNARMRAREGILTNENKVVMKIALFYSAKYLTQKLIRRFWILPIAFVAIFSMQSPASRYPARSFEGSPICYCYL